MDVYCSALEKIENLLGHPSFHSGRSSQAGEILPYDRSDVSNSVVMSRNYLIFCVFFWNCYLGNL